MSGAPEPDASIPWESMTSSDNSDAEEVSALIRECGDLLRRCAEERARGDGSRGWRAMMLAKDLETYRALLRGETVPLERLDAKWLARFGRKR